MVTSHLTCHSLLQKHSAVTLQISRYINMLIPPGTNLVIKFLLNCMHAANDREHKSRSVLTHTHTYTPLTCAGFQVRDKVPVLAYVTYCLPAQNISNPLTFTRQYIHSTVQNIHLQISADWHTYTLRNCITDLWSCLDGFSTWYTILKLYCNVVCTNHSPI